MEKNTSKTNLIILGGSKLLFDILNTNALASQYNIVGCVAINASITHPIGASQYPCYEGMSAFYNLQQQHKAHGIVDIQDLALKKNCINSIRKACKSMQFINLVHPSAVLGKNVHLGIGTIIGAKVIMNSDSRVADFCTIYNRVSIGHDSRIENYVTVHTNATIGGNTVIGEASYVGMSANIVNNITIAEQAYIEANTLVLHNVAANTKMQGIPAKVV